MIGGTLTLSLGKIVELNKSSPSGDLPNNSPANSLACLCKVWLDAHEVSIMEERVSEMEGRLYKAGLQKTTNTYIHYRLTFFKGNTMEKNA